MSIENPTTEINSVAQEQIDRIAEKCAKIKPLVAINCITYNHEAYLRDALEGFVMQKTDFPFVAIVHDDASTDGTADIIREYVARYPDIILPIYETENQYSKRDGSVSRIMHTARNATGAKYVAYCEGDDFWTVPHKLQKQVDFLESNPDFSMVCSQYDSLFQINGDLVKSIQGRTDEVLSLNSILLNNKIATLTVLIRLDCVNEYRLFAKDCPNLSFSDYPIWLFAATKGHIMKFPQTTAVYRILPQSASHGLSKESRLRWIRSEFKLLDYWIEKQDIPKNVMLCAVFNRCSSATRDVIKFNDTTLIQRIRDFYWTNHLYIAWLSFMMMIKFPKLSWLTNLIENHICIKSPKMYYLFNYAKIQ